MVRIQNTHLLVIFALYLVAATLYVFRYDFSFAVQQWQTNTLSEEFAREEEQMARRQPRRSAASTPGLKSRFEAGTAASPKVEYKGYVEVAGVRSVSSALYRAELGPKLGVQNGYTLFRTKDSSSAVLNFDGTLLPVLTDIKTKKRGILTGEIAITFRRYPEDVSEFARLNQLRILYEARHIDTIYVAPLGYPADLVGLVDHLDHLTDIKSAEWAVITAR